MNTIRSRNRHLGTSRLRLAGALRGLAVAVAVAAAVATAGGCATGGTGATAATRGNPPPPVRTEAARAAYLQALDLKLSGDWAGYADALSRLARDHPDTLYGRKARRILIQSMSVNALGTVTTTAAALASILQKGGFSFHGDGEGDGAVEPGDGRGSGSGGGDGGSEGDEGLENLIPGDGGEDPGAGGEEGF